MFDTVPVGKMTRYRCHLGCILLKMAAISLLTGLSLHCDAWRDINLSYENATEDDPWCGCPCRVVVDVLVNPCGGRACQRLSGS